MDFDSSNLEFLFVILKTEMYTPELVNANNRSPIFKLKGTWNEKESFDFVNLNSQVFCAFV